MDQLCPCKYRPYDMIVYEVNRLNRAFSLDGGLVKKMGE